MKSQRSITVAIKSVLILLLLSIAAIVGVASASEIYVPDDYTKIQWAVDNASAGDTIIVRNGTYYENVVVANKQITLQGVDRNGTVIDGKSTGSVITLVESPGVAIRGFKLTGSELTWDGAGIKVRSNNITISDNIVTGNGVGIWLHGHGGGIISSNLINNNIVTANWKGIYLQYANESAVSNNAVSSNDGDGTAENGDGIMLSHASKNTITNNTVKANNGAGLVFFSSHDNNVTGNTALDNHWEEIYMSNSDSNLIYNNYFNNTNNAYDDGNNVWNITKTNGTNIINGPYLGGNYWGNYTGIDEDGDGLGDTPYDIPGGANNDYLPLVFPPPPPKTIYVWYNFTDDPQNHTWDTIHEGLNDANDGDTIIVYNGTYYGVVDIPKSVTLQGEGSDTTVIHGEWLVDRVVYVTADNVTVSGFTVTGTVESGAYGIYVSSADYCNISDNIVSDGDYGIYLTNSDYSVVARNNASDRRGYGIRLSSCDNCLVDGNTANSNDNYGIYLSYSSSNNITNNIANSNDYHGIYLYYSDNNNITNNTANSNYDHGFFLYYSDNNNITNNIANSNYDHGIYLYYSDNNNVTNNTANLNNNYGIYLYHSSSNNITSNTASNNNYGIHLYSTSIDNIITKNTIAYNDEGIHLYYSGSNLLYRNNLITNTLQAYDHNGFNDWDNGAIIGGNYWSDHKCTGNPSNGSQPYTKIDTNAGAVDRYPFENYCVPPPWRTIYVPDNYTKIQWAVDAANPGDTIIVRDGTYVENVHIGKSLVIRSENGSATTTIQALNFNDHVFEVTKHHVTINGFMVTGATGSGKAGIYLGSNAEHCNISGNNALNNYYGIYLDHSFSNSITNNTANSNDNYCIYLYYSSNNNITNNAVKLNDYGIYLFHSNNNDISNNTASNNNYGIWLYYYSSDNNITNNIVNSNRHYGILLNYYSSDNNLINNIVNSNNNYGIYVGYSSNNNLIYNNYFNNTNNAYDEGNNVWNVTKREGTNIIGGPYLGGNYWSDYIGIDEDGDGIGDTPYNITGGSNKDYLPLVRVLPDLVITEKWVNWPDNCTICYNVTNIGNGTAPAGHNTTLFVDGVEKAHDSLSVELAPNASYISCFKDYNWTYTSPDDNITVCTDCNNTVAEDNETNNCLISTWKCGDVNMKDNVDFLGDAIGVARHYMYDETIKCPWAGDVDCSGDIDFLGDAIKIARHYMYGEPLNCCCET